MELIIQELVHLGLCEVAFIIIIYYIEGCPRRQYRGGLYEGFHCIKEAG